VIQEQKARASAPAGEPVLLVRYGNYYRCLVRYGNYYRCLVRYGNYYRCAGTQRFLSLPERVAYF
jgi:hypothetical protein